MALRIPKVKRINNTSSAMMNSILIVGEVGAIIMGVILGKTPRIPKPNDCFRWYFANGDFPPLLYNIKETIQPSIVM